MEAVVLLGGRLWELGQEDSMVAFDSTRNTGTGASLDPDPGDAG